MVLGLAAAGFGCGDDESATGAANTGAGPGSGGMATGGGTAAGGMGPGSGGNGASSGSTGGGGASTVAQNQFLYVANQDDNNVVVYAIDPAGALDLVETEDVAGAPGPLAVAPAEDRLYVAAVNGRAISAFDIDPATGALTAIGSPVSVAPRPVYISVDATGGFLLLASYGDNVAESYSILGDGSIDGTPITSLPGPGNNPHSIVLHPSNDFAFVPNTNPVPETISQLVLNADGSLTTNPAGATIDVSGSEPVGPRHLTFHPTLDILYAVNEHSDSVTVYDFNPANGTLNEGATTSTLPGGSPSGANTCADIHITPDGSALYASNRGDNSLAMFSVDAAGALTGLGHIATEDVPREFEVTRDGRFVYAAGQNSDMLAAYAVESDGSLTALTTYAVGQRPMWVLAISVDRPE